LSAIASGAQSRDEDLHLKPRIELLFCAATGIADRCACVSGAARDDRWTKLLLRWLTAVVRSSPD
jgi:hypothetical protein